MRQAKANLRAMATDARLAQSLRDDLEIQVLVDTLDLFHAAVETDFYWAVYYHDGRGPIRARPGKYLVFFRNPDDDPRIGGPARNYPRRVADIQRLSLPKDEFLSLLRSGKMIATKRVGPAGAHPFFERGFAALQSQYGPLAVRRLGEFIMDYLGEDLRPPREEATFSL